MPVQTIDHQESTAHVSSAEKIRRPLAHQPGGGQEFWTVCLTDPAELEGLESDWLGLAAAAADPNVFYEPWFFLPAVEHLGHGQDWRLLLIYRSENDPTAAPELCGFFPFVKTSGSGWLPQWTLWKHRYCFLTNPLLRRGTESDVFRAVWQFLGHGNSSVQCVEFGAIAGEGAVHQGLVGISRELLSTSFIADRHLRATIRYPSDADAYLKSTVSGHHLRELRRTRRKLEAIGHLEYRVSDEPSQAQIWTEWFLRLESRGWKARAGTAIGQHDGDARFFHEMIEGGARERRIGWEGLFLNGQPIAIRCNLIRSPACFAFKIAFEEMLGKYSPGMQLEMESLHHAAEHPSWTWADSCAPPQHSMIERIWTERRVIQHLVLSTGVGLSEIVVGSLPLLRACHRARKRWLRAVAGVFPEGGNKSPNREQC